MPSTLKSCTVLFGRFRCKWSHRVGVGVARHEDIARKVTFTNVEDIKLEVVPEEDSELWASEDSSVDDVGVGDEAADESSYSDGS